MRPDRLTTKLNSFVSMTPRELEFLAELQSTPIRVEKGRELIRQGHRGEFAYILQAGWGCSFKVLQNGERQVITFPIPGDCVGLRSVLLRTSYELSDALGLSAMHVNRVLRQLREMSLLTVHNHVVTIGNLACLKLLPGY